MKQLRKPVAAILLAALILFGAAQCLRSVGEQNAQRHHLQLLQTLLPGSTEFVLEPYSGTDENIRSVHKAEGGFVVETVTAGYAGDITMLVAVTKEGKVTGLVVKEQHETFGLGSGALTDHVFLSQFLQTDELQEVGADVDALTGATVTSKAVARSVGSAVAFVTGADIGSAATSWGG